VLIIGGQSLSLGSRLGSDVIQHETPSRREVKDAGKNSLHLRDIATLR